MQVSARAAARTTPRDRYTPKQVLVVEDDPDQTMMLKDYLEAYSYRVTTAAHGAEAIKLIMDRDFDVVLCDIMMPTMPGDTFYYAVQRVKPSLCDRFIFVTAHGENPRVQEFLQQFSEMVLMKPYHLDDLLEMILLLFQRLESARYILRESQELPRANQQQPSVNVQTAAPY